MNNSIEHIIVENGIARTKNHRVKVKMIALKYLKGGATPQEIAEHYGITLADVHAALTCYYDNLAIFEAQERENEALGEKYSVRAEDQLAQMRAKFLENTKE